MLIYPLSTCTIHLYSTYVLEGYIICDAGTNEDKIIDILAHHSNEQRQGIKEAFQAEFDEVSDAGVDYAERLHGIMGWHNPVIVCVSIIQDLVSTLKGELRSDFEDVVVALLATPRVYDAMELRRAMKVSLVL